jgi:hypothetical protein
MSRFSIQFLTNNQNNTPSISSIHSIPNKKTYFNKNMHYYICSYGGSGSTVLFNYLSNFGNVYHIHDRYPPNKLTYVGKQNTSEDVYNEWFNNVEIPEEHLANYKVIFIYRHPIQVIFSRLAQAKGPNIPHLQHIKCNNNGNINIFDVLRTKKDLYGLEEFFNNYTMPSNKNYPIYSIKYELFWNNISLFNYVLGLPDIKGLYPVKQERPKRFSFVNELSFIYRSLIYKMNKSRFIEIIRPLKEEKEISMEKDD